MGINIQKEKEVFAPNNHNLIRPYRNIPVDLGHSLNSADISSIKIALANIGILELEIPSILQRFSKDIALRFLIDENIRLYIYTFGIGVFAIKDSDYLIVNDKYAVDYCERRKTTHHDLLNGTHIFSNKILSVIQMLRECIRTNHKIIRITADENWENHGLSYVMTVSAIQISSLAKFGYQDLSEIEKRNLMIMLEPGIAHQEDTLLFDSGISAECIDPYSIEITNHHPTNWLKSNDAGLYISWAAVVIYANHIADESIKYLEYLEVDLQAMWMYVYCMYYVISHCNQKQMKMSVLKKELFSFKKMYNEFTSSNDSSVAEYFINIRNELIRTSGIEKEKEKYVEYLEYCIEETLSLNEERSRKYTIISEILLFIIAYAQIIPLLYHLLVGDYVNLNALQIFVIIAIGLISTILIVRKE